MAPPSLNETLTPPSSTETLSDTSCSNEAGEQVLHQSAKVYHRKSSSFLARLNLSSVGSSIRPPFAHNNTLEEQMFQSDQLASTDVEGLELLKDMIRTARSSRRYQNRSHVFNFAVTTSLLELFPNATLDDMLMAFVRWSQEDQSCRRVAQAQSTNGSHVYNISKSFRRLETYASWMERASEDLLPLTSVGMLQDVWNIFGMKLSHDKEDRLVWFVDLKKLDCEKGEVSHTKTGADHSHVLRMFTFLCHVIALDSRGQKNGLVVVHNVANKGRFYSSKLLPVRLFIKLDKITMGTLPIRLQKVYLLNTSGFLKVLVRLVNAIMTRKMRERIEPLDDAKELLSFLGAENVPVGMMDGATMEKDLVACNFPALAVPDDLTSTTAVDDNRSVA